MAGAETIHAPAPALSREEERRDAALQMVALIMNTIGARQKQVGGPRWDELMMLREALAKMGGGLALVVACAPSGPAT